MFGLCFPYSRNTLWESGYELINRRNFTWFLYSNQNYLDWKISLVASGRNQRTEQLNWILVELQTTRKSRYEKRCMKHFSLVDRFCYLVLVLILNPLSINAPIIICIANQLIGFYMIGILVVNELKVTSTAKLFFVIK